MTDIFTKTIQIKVQQVPLKKEFHTHAYTLYRYAQQEDDSRGLIARTLNYPEYLLFSIQSITPLEGNMQVDQYVRRTEKKLGQLLEKIPSFTPSMIESLLIPQGTYTKLYEYSISTGLSFEDIMLYSVFELVRVKNPRSQYNPDSMKYHQCCWINASESFVSYSPAELELAHINRLINNLRVSIDNLNERWESLGYPDFERARQYGHDLEEMKKQQQMMLKLFETSDPTK